MEAGTVYAITGQLMRLGDDLRGLREARGITAADLARRIETQPDIIEQIELGSLEVPVGTLLRVAAELGAALQIVPD